MSRSVFEAMSILVVDDSAYMRHLLMTLLQALGVKEVHLAIDGDEALALPMDGFSFAHRLRSIRGRALSMIPIIMVSGHTDIASVERARDIGITEFLSKPISARSLYERLIQVIDRPRQFVEAPTYRGPDRRRRDRPFEGQDRRNTVALI
jgi:CheY-like chemotaxis protein